MPEKDETQRIAISLTLKQKIEALFPSEKPENLNPNPQEAQERRLYVHECRKFQDDSKARKQFGLLSQIVEPNLRTRTLTTAGYDL